MNFVRFPPLLSSEVYTIRIPSSFEFCGNCTERAQAVQTRVYLTKFDILNVARSLSTLPAWTATHCVYSQPQDELFNIQPVPWFWTLSTVFQCKTTVNSGISFELLVFSEGSGLKSRFGDRPSWKVVLSPSRKMSGSFLKICNSHPLPSNSLHADHPIIRLCMI